MSRWQQFNIYTSECGNLGEIHAIRQEIMQAYNIRHIHFIPTNVDNIKLVFSRATPLARHTLQSALLTTTVHTTCIARAFLTEPLRSRADRHTLWTDALIRTSLEQWPSGNATTKRTHGNSLWNLPSSLVCHLTWTTGVAELINTSTNKVGRSVFEMHL